MSLGYHLHNECLVITTLFRKELRVKVFIGTGMKISTQSTITCSKLKIETLERGVKKLTIKIPVER